jgi:hypothetical protein
VRYFKKLVRYTGQDLSKFDLYKVQNYA